MKARYAMSWIGVRELGYFGADVARYLGVTNSCVTIVRILMRGNRPELAFVWFMEVGLRPIWKRMEPPPNPKT
ncbi:MAG: hypothetical protein DRH24_11550 [Deltaproteobacteria bacterium]|nr:MAG: hypothetical protein DRH24_11550 [Deltaproteobacteria bacterium]